MARIELSQSTLAKIREGIKMSGDAIFDREHDLLIFVDYKLKTVSIQNVHTDQLFDLNCRDRRVIFKYFEK